MIITWFIYDFLLLFCTGHMLTVFFSQYFVCVCVIFSVTTAVNIFCVLTMGDRVRWLWLSGSRPLIFLLWVLLFVKSVYDKIKKFLLLQNSFTSRLSSDCITNWSLKIPPHVAACPSWAYKQDYWFILTSELKQFGYVLRYHSISFDKFFWLWSFPYAVFIQPLCA